MKKKLKLNKQGLIKLWKTQCAEAGIDTVLEKNGRYYSIKINDDLSLAVFSDTINIIFGGQIQYLTENIATKEFSELENLFLEAEETVERFSRDRITSNGLKALERLLDK